MRYLLLVALFYAPMLGAVPIRAMPDGTAYIFRVVVKCGDRAVIAPAVTERAELDATLAYSEGRSSAQDYLEAMVQADPKWAQHPAGLQQLMQFATLCDQQMKLRRMRLGEVRA